VELGQVFLSVILFSPVSIVPLWLSTLIYISGVNNRPLRGRSLEILCHPIDMKNNGFLAFVLIFQSDFTSQHVETSSSTVAFSQLAKYTINLLPQGTVQHVNSLM
jgi:hypothetical protein